MLTLTSSVPELAVHVFEPIMRQITHKIVYDIGMAAKLDNKFYYITDQTSSSKSTDENNNPTLRENRLTCTMRPNMNADSSKWEMATPSHFNGRYISDRDMGERDPVFWDTSLGMVLSEHTVPCMMTFECVMTFKENSDAYQAMSRMNRYYGNTEKISINNLVFDYALPKDVYYIIYLIYKMNGGLQENFVDYLKTCSCNDIDVLVNRYNSALKELSVSKTACNGLATIEMTQDKPTEEKINQTPLTYNLEFVITLQFERVDLLILRYPPVVRNVLVPDYAVFVEPDKQWGNIVAFHPYINMENYLKREMEYPQKERGVVKTVNCIRFPWYDRWMLPANSPLRALGYKPFFISIVLLDDIENEAGSTMIDLSAPLDGYRSFVPEVIQMFQDIGSMTLFMEDYVNISVYANDKLVEPTMLEFTDGVHLNILNRDISKVYRLVISEHPGRKLSYIPQFRVLAADIITHF